MGISTVISLGLLLVQGGVHAAEIRHDQQLFQRTSLQASLLRSRGEFEEAVVALQQALSISRQNKLDYNHRKCLVRMAILKWNLGNISESSSYFSEALAAYKQVGDKRSEEFCFKCINLIQLYNQGKEDRKAELYHRSLEEFEQAIFLGREIGFPDFELKCLRQQGLTFWDMRRFDLFLESNKRGLDISTKINHGIEKGRCLNNIGVYYQKQNDYSRAAVYFENALAVIRTVDDRPTEAECLSNLGILYRELGNLTRALLYLSSALELDKNIGDLYSISIDLDNIGTIYLRKGLDNQNRQDLFHALNAFQNCLSLQGMERMDSYIKFTALNNIGIIQNELKNHINARRYFVSAMKVVESEKYVLEKCHVLCNIAASFFYEKNIEGALEYYRLSYELGSKKSLENVVMESCLGLGQCYERKHEYPVALSFYRKSIEAMENVRDRISSELFMIWFARNKLRAYQSAIRIMANQYSAQPSNALLEKIFQLIERAKARAFLENLKEARVDTADVNSPSLNERQQGLSKKISELSRLMKDQAFPAEKRQILNNELEHEEEEYFRLASELNAEGRINSGALQKEICSILKVQRQIIDKKTVLLEYFVGDEESYLVFLSQRNAKLYVLGGRAEIEKSLRAYLKMISDGSIDEKAGFEAAERIRRELIPLEKNEDLKNAKSLIVIPDGILHFLPFETIRVRDEHGSKYLIENLAISYCPSASSLYVLKSKKRSRIWKKGMLAIGGPRYGHGMTRVDEFRFDRKDVLRKLYYEQGFRLDPLPFSKKEVIDIAKLFKKNGVHVLVGEAANEETVKKLSLEEFQIIHFACHGFLDEKYPFRSALVLSLCNQQEEDGFLQIREIYGLSINADLVVLSACQTGQGMLERAEGPMGLTRPFFVAGARSVIASLWPINDKATVVFMREFYKHIVGGHAAGEALRFAKLKMIKSSWIHPFYWASFILHGDPSSVSTLY